MVNRVILIGNLGRDPEVRRLENGAVVAKFSVATNENYKDKSGEWQSQTEWHDIVVWRSLAERAEQQLKKGAQIYLEGKLTHRSWQDQEGNNRRTTEVVANYFRMIGRREGGGDQGGGYFPSANDEQQTNTNFSSPSTSPAAPATTAPQQDTGAPADDDLPF
ncbi:MAG: single-stranded DNA-binding protein [Saprospiraceae bacterium]|nr:single-stranded DNA-binding protein [Saprospiraceae bacterium]